MDGNPLRTFIDLVNFDQHIFASKRMLDVLNSEIADLSTKKIFFEQELTRLKTALHVLRKEVDQKDREVKDFDQQEQQLKRKLDRVANPKEYFSVQQELDTLSKQRSLAEDQLLEMWNQLTFMQQEVALAEQDTLKNLELTEAAFQTKQDQMQKKQHEYEKDLSQRATMISVTRVEWLDQYLQMLNKIDNPVVPVANQSCGGCFNAISNADVLALDKRKLVTCKNCYRLLYSPEKL